VDGQIEQERGVTNGEDNPAQASGEADPSSASANPAGSISERNAGLSGQLAGGAAEAAAAEEVSGRWIALDFEVHKSIRYHGKRRGFFDSSNNLIRAVSAIFAAGAIVSIVGGSHVATIVVAALLAVLSSIDLVIDFSRRARVYDDLYRDFCELAANIEETAVRDEAQLRTFAARKLRIEAREPTVKDVLAVICANEELEGRGYDHKYRVRWWQRPFSHFFSLPPYDFPEIPARVAKITHQPG